MNIKLTLNVDQSVVEDAKVYASNNKVSLSKLVENYLQSLSKKKTKKKRISPLVESLTGVIPDQGDYKKGYADYLAKKYS